MANREAGEIDLTLAGKTYTLKIGTGALIMAQEAVSTPDRFVTPEQLFEHAAKGRLLYIRAIMWAALQKFHRGITLAQVEEILDGTSEDESKALLAALGRTTIPDPRDVAELELKGDGPRPQTAQATPAKDGTGEVSTSSPDASA